jgi:hypothetical protein
VPDDQRGALIDQCEDRACEILTERWKTVERLVEAQVGRGRIEGAVLAAIREGGERQG